MHSFTAYKLSS